MSFTELTHIKARMQAARAAAIAQFHKQGRPDALLRDLRRIVDHALRELLELCPLPEGAALAAVGGYGRGELYPHSDVDLLILLPDPPPRAAPRPDEPQAASAPPSASSASITFAAPLPCAPPRASGENAVERLVAALWDLGLEPGHSVRTIAQCEQEAQADITVETALLESRWLAGERKLFRQFKTAMAARLDERAFFVAKRVEMQQRHARHRDTPYALEPNCKESPGGLRDLQVILWMARAANFGHTWKQIAQAGLLTPDEARTLHGAEQVFKRLRIELHLLAKRREDRLLFDLQPGLAAVYGIAGTATRRASELLMQRYYRAAGQVAQLNVILVQNIEERLFPRPANEAQAIDADFRRIHERLDIIHDDAFQRNPSLMLRAFLVMQQHATLTGMSARTMRAIWHARGRIDAAFRNDPANHRLFLEILQQPAGIVHELRRMVMLDVLPRYLPVFKRIVGQMQHDLFHVYTVDQHILQVLRNVRRFTMPEHAQEYPLASQLIASFDKHWLLYVAALFHDIAKGRGSDHSQLGAIEVRRFAKQHELSAEDGELVEFLVRHHLLMSTVAQKRDLSDPAVIDEFAGQVRDERRLTALYLLTVADIRGTSPRVWNAWKGKLLEDLYRLALARLGGAHADAGTVLAQRQEEATRLIRLAGLSDADRDLFWKQLDVAYFLRHEPSEIAWHTRHLYRQRAPDKPVVRVRPTEQGEGLQVMVYTRDAPQLFANTCGYFDSKSLSIQDARVHTTRHGWALDSYIVLPSEPDGDLRSLASLVEHELAERLTSPNTARQGSARPRLSRLSKAFPIMPLVELQPDEGSQSWRLLVTATDRPGLLHALAQVFALHEVSLIMAKIMTLGDRVEDVFIVSGAALERPRSQMQFERGVLRALTGETLQEHRA